MIFSNPRQNKNYSNPKQDFQYMQFSNKIRPRLLEANTSYSVIERSNVEEKSEKKMKWGEPTWFLFHTLAQKIKEDHFLFIRRDLLNIIYSICTNLPCPICSKHAMDYLNGINFNAIQTKQQLKDALFIFHNVVNKRKNFPLFDYNQLVEKYSKANTQNIIQNFSIYYTEKNKITKLIADNFIRGRIVHQLTEWMNANSFRFDG